MKKQSSRGGIGQDDRYLAEILLEKGYHVYGTKRRASHLNSARIDRLYQKRKADHPVLIISDRDLMDPFSMPWMMLKQEVHDNFVIQTGVKYNVRIYSLDFEFIRPSA